MVKAEMLHADSDNAFCRSCESGYLEIASGYGKFVLMIKSQMLYAQDRGAFCVACENGHIEIAKWLWAILSDRPISNVTE